MTGSERRKSVGDEYPHHLDTSSIALAFRIAIGEVVEENSENVYSSEEFCKCVVEGMAMGRSHLLGTVILSFHTSTSVLSTCRLFRNTRRSSW